MATRAIVKVEGMNLCNMYKHWDGYPDGMLPFLEKFNREFTAKRGDDPSYKMAQLLRATVLLAEKYNLDKSDCTGYGIVPCGDNCGADFVYTLKKDGSVTYKPVL